MGEISGRKQDTHEGRREWINAAVDRYEEPLLRYALRITGDADIARDVVQEVFLRLWRRQGGESDDHLAPWLFPVCRNRALDVVRKERRMKPIREVHTRHRPGEDPPPSRAAAPPAGPFRHPAWTDRRPPAKMTADDARRNAVVKRFLSALLLSVWVCGCGQKPPSSPPATSEEHDLGSLAGSDAEDRWAGVQRLPEVAEASRPRVRQKLREILRTGPPRARRAAAVALAEMEPSAVDLLPALIEALDDADGRVGGAALQAILRLDRNRPEVRAAIESAAGNREEKVSLPAVDALAGMSRTPEITAVLAGCLDHRVLLVRRRAMEALIATGLPDPDTRAALTGAIDNEYRDVRLAAVEAFVAADPTIDGVAAGLGKAAAGDDAKPAEMARARLTELDPAAPGVLTAWAEIMRSADVDTRRKIIERLCQAPPEPPVVEMIGRAISDEDHLAAMRAMQRLIELGPKSRPAAPMLLGFLADTLRPASIDVFDLLAPMAAEDPALAERFCDALLAEDGHARTRTVADLCPRVKGLGAASGALAALVVRDDIAQAKKLAALEVLTIFGGAARPAEPVLRDYLQRGAPSRPLREAVEAFLAHLAVAPAVTTVPEDH